MSTRNGANPGPAETVRVSLPHDRDRIDALQSSLMEAVEQAGYPKPARFAIKLAFEEALMNAFHHGHKGLGEDVEVRVEYAVARDEVYISVEDQGPGFDPNKVPDPTLDENLALPSGRGIMLMRAYMTDVSHNATGNRVHLRYVRPAD
jgi:serine/threonine-protein kinase RsbW